MNAQTTFDPFAHSDTAIYFDLPDEVYHGVEALSNSGIKELLVDPLDFWFNSWMNPFKVDEETPAKTFGKAFHKYMLEGEEAFNAAFIEEPHLHDHDALSTTEDMKEWLHVRGLKRSGRKDELRARILENDPKVKFWDDLKANLIGKRTVLKKRDIQEIETRCKLVRAIPSIHNIVKDGYAEVSIFWTEQSDHGPVRMKARLDKLKSNGTIADVKTFQNSQRRKLEAAVTWEIATRKYYLQAALYHRAVKAMIDAYKNKNLFAPAVPKGFLKDLEKAPHIRFALIFVQNHGAPNAIARELREFETLAGNTMTPNGYWRNATEAWKYAVQRFGRFSSHFGAEPWIEEKPVKALTDHDFPLFVQDGMI